LAQLGWILLILIVLAGTAHCVLKAIRTASKDRPGQAAADGRGEPVWAELRALLPVLRENLQDVGRSTEKGVLEAAQTVGEVTGRIRKGLAQLNTIWQIWEGQEKSFRETYQKN